MVELECITVDITFEEFKRTAAEAGVHVSKYCDQMRCESVMLLTEDGKVIAKATWGLYNFEGYEKPKKVEAYVFN
jgi:hypothetical protein